MALSADVRSIEALKEFRVSLCAFVESARVALGEAESDLQRCAGWLADDRQRYWKAEQGRRTEQVQRAKLVLLEKKLQKTSSGGRPSCVDEEKALTLAIRRLEEAQQKHESTRRWMRRLEEQVFQYKGLIQALNHALDSDAVVSLALLDRMTVALDAYVALAPPPGVELEPAESQAESMTRPVDEQTEMATPTTEQQPVPQDQAAEEAKRQAEVAAAEKSTEPAGDAESRNQENRL